jgi:hypothetical protein
MLEVKIFKSEKNEGRRAICSRWERREQLLNPVKDYYGRPNAGMMVASTCNAYSN